MRTSGATMMCVAIIALSLPLEGCTRKPSFPSPEITIRGPARTLSSPASNANDAPSLSVPSEPKSMVIEVPFSPQAPFASWDPLHEEACEEMSLIMVHHFLEGLPLTPEDAEEELQKLVAWEEKHEFPNDVDVHALGSIANAYYGHRFRLLSEVKTETLRQELAAGNPVIIPAAGRMLGNPFYSGEGPYYHMLVVTGYTADGFITNDPGTKRGEKYWYSASVLRDAIHDWTGVKESITTGARTALVLEL